MPLHMCGIPLKNGGDIIEALAPLFAPIANARVGRKFVAADFAKAMQDDYGIYMHPYVAEDWAPRLADGGILEPVNSSTSYAEFIYRYTEIGDVADYLKSSEQIFEAFRIYVRPLLLRLEREIPSDADLNEMLFERIKGMAFEDILNKPDVIAIKTRTLMLSALEEEQEENPEAREMREMMDVAVATFIIEIEEGGSPLSKQPSDIALG
ncbi:MAG TPA: hypothetical protein VFS04_13150, partial [Alphaproteobacteria bacterium]|nr:hypothetical protein [Alphaproteobacteria bacterium]